MATRYQMHHITYQPPWTVQINMLMHRTISRIQITKATPEAYAGLTNFVHAVNFEHNRMRQELDIGGDLRNLKPKLEGEVKKIKSKLREEPKKRGKLKRRENGNKERVHKG